MNLDIAKASQQLGISIENLTQNSQTNLNECGVDRKYLKLIHSYCSNRKQRANLNDTDFYKGHFYGLCCSRFSYATCFTSLKTFIMQLMPMTLHDIMRKKVLDLLSTI